MFGLSTKEVLYKAIVYEKCKHCGKTRRIYRKSFLINRAYYFGPKIHKCNKCGYIYYDQNAIELSTCSKKHVKEECRDYTFGGYRYFFFPVFFLVCFAFYWLTPHSFLFDGLGGIIAIIFFGVVFPYSIYCILRYRYFWKRIYKESYERMQDKEYLDLMRRYFEENEED